MNVNSFNAIKRFIRKHANSRAPLNAWYKITRKAQWRSFHDVKKTYQTVDKYGRCLIFNIGGNNYRLIAGVNYEAQIVYIKAVLTHAEYDKQKWKSDC